MQVRRRKKNCPNATFGERLELRLRHNRVECARRRLPMPDDPLIEHKNCPLRWKCPGAEQLFGVPEILQIRSQKHGYRRRDAESPRRTGLSARSRTYSCITRSPPLKSSARETRSRCHGCRTRSDSHFLMSGNSSVSGALAPSRSGLTVQTAGGRVESRIAFCSAESPSSGLTRRPSCLAR